MSNNESQVASSEKQAHKKSEQKATPIKSTDDKKSKIAAVVAKAKARAQKEREQDQHLTVSTNEKVTTTTADTGDKKSRIAAAIAKAKAKKEQEKQKASLSVNDSEALTSFKSSNKEST